MENYFPQVYRRFQRQSDSQANLLYQNFVKRIQKDHQCLQKLILSESQKTKFKSRVEEAQKYSVIFYCGYGCALVFYKKQSFSPISVSLVFPKEWDFDISISSNKVIYLADKPKSSTSFELGELNEDYQTLQQANTKLSSLIKDVLIEQERVRFKKYGDKDRKNHHTPSFMIEIVKQTFKRIQQKRQKKIVQIGKKQQEKEPVEILSKGGTLDVGIHTGTTKPNTTLPVVVSILQFIFQSQNMVNLILFDSKICELKLAISREKQCKMLNLKNYQQCLSQVTHIFKGFVNQGISFNEEYFQKQIQLVYQALKKIPHPNVIQKITVRGVADSIQCNLKMEKKDAFSTILRYDVANMEFYKQAGSLGFSKSLSQIINFKDLYDKKSLFSESFWLLMVESYFFSIATQRLGVPNRPVQVDIQQIKCSQYGLSKMHDVIYAYDAIINDKDKAKNYGMKLKNQQYSHYYLIRYIGAAVAFEVVKEQRKDKHANLEEYRCPESISSLYQLFYSLSFEARNALESMIAYFARNRQKKQLFVLEESNKSYYQFVNKVAEEDTTIKNWIVKKKEQLEQSIDKLEYSMQRFKQKYEKCKNQKISQEVKTCSCYYQEVGYKRYKKQQLVKCQRCKTKQTLSEQINTYECEKQAYIISNFAILQQNLFGFLNNIPSDILGLMKIIYESQINFIEDKSQSNDKNYFSKGYAQLIVYGTEVKSKNFSLHQNYTKMAQNFVLYPAKQTKFYYRGNAQASRVSEDLLSPQKVDPLLFELSHQYMMSSPSLSNSAREHQAYAKLSLKKKQESIEEYLHLASIRVASPTQLLTLTQKLKNRQISINFLLGNHKLPCQNQKLLHLKSLIILNCAACVQSFKYFEGGTLTLYPIIKECITDFLKNYINQWKYEDMYFLHIIGACFSLMSKLLGMQKYALEVAMKAFSQYEKNVTQNKSGDNTVKSNLAYFLHGAFSFFNEDLTYSLDKESIFLWTKIQLLYRINKVFSDQNIKDQRYRETMIFFEFYRERAIFNNIENVLEYFKQHPSQLTQIVKLIDLDISQQTKWNYLKEKGDYVFVGQFQNKTYEVNLFSGILLKNGAELAGLPEIIKKNKNYVSIFGQNRDLEVYPEKDGSLRTRIDFAAFFPNQINTVILFEFKILEKDVIIRKIVKKDKKQHKYVLIPEVILNESNFHMPELYLKVYFAWYCDQENILVFRSKKIQELKNVCLIILTKKIKEKLEITEARIVQNNLKLESIDFIKKPSNSDLFDLLIFRSKNANINKAVHALSSIEHNSYILQISSPNREKEDGERLTKFWLHRYNLKFTFSPEKGILSDNFHGYAVSQFYNSHEYLPWSSGDEIKCLILEKINSGLSFAKNHKTMVIVPNLHINSISPKTTIPLGPTTEMKVFSYQIHDHFHDLRGKKMLQQLHLACLVAAGFSSKLTITNIEYAVHILRSCQTIKPLNKQERAKLDNIFKNSIYLNQYVITLICYVIYQSTRIVQHILPYQKKNKDKKVGQQPEKQKKNNIFLEYFQLVQNCKYKYRTNFAQEKISVRQQLSQLELKILRLDNYTHLLPHAQREKSRWQERYRTTMTVPLNYDEKILQWENDLHESYNYKQNLLGGNIRQEKNDQVQATCVIQLEQKCNMSRGQKHQIESSLKSYSNIKKKLLKIELNQSDKKRCLKDLKLTKQKIHQNTADILKILKEMQTGQSKNLDFISKKRSLMHQVDFTNILCTPSNILLFYPDATSESIQKFCKAILKWMQHTIEFNSIERIEQILQDEELDKISLLRQIESPRKEISQTVAWICFEVEMKTQIWQSQLQTFKLLDKNNSGVVTQLNMGEGKTQVIIPMIVLNQIYNKRCQIPRVNILTPLYHEAQENYFKFLSITGFKLHSLPIQFNRDVEINQLSINRLQYAIELYKNNSLVLVDRDSTLSMILKIRQQHGFKKNQINSQLPMDRQCHKKDRWIFRNLKILDIFDEVDALMTAKKSFVYAVGNSSSLPQGRIRFEYSCLFIEIIVKEMLEYLIKNEIATLDECFDHALTRIIDGKYPKGFRFLARITEQKIISFREKLVRLFFTKYLPPQFQFYKQLESEEKQNLIKYCINEKQTSSIIPKGISTDVYNQIFIVRGLLAYGVIQHCLTLRNGVDYGVPDPDNIKKVGVPYEAADVPSKRSEYSHPEVATILSYLSYFNKGLTEDQFKNAVKCLLSQTKSSKRRNYQRWIACIQNQSMHPQSALHVEQINKQSAVQIQELYKSFQFCRATIVFWLVHCVFPTDLAQYTKSITSSSWDLADSKNAVGFSGTKDSHWLFPEYLYLKESINDEINGTDGKMIELMLENTKGVLLIKDNDDDLWKRFCQTALELKVGCIIDVGAILAGKSLEKQIVPWISNHPIFKKLYFKGISFCNESGIWKVYDTSNHSTIGRETSIPEHETFVIFDQARTRGADMKMKAETVAALSLGPNMTKDKLMQAVGRLRKFGRNQKIYFCY